MTGVRQGKITTIAGRASDKILKGTEPFGLPVKSLCRYQLLISKLKFSVRKNALAYSGLHDVTQAAERCIVGASGVEEERPERLQVGDCVDVGCGVLRYIHHGDEGRRLIRVSRGRV